MRRALILVLALVGTSCGSSSTAPSPPPPASVAGAWSGTWQASQASGAYILALVFNLTQAGANVSGTWATSQGNGTISGATTASSFSGTLTWNGSSVIGGACTGSFAASGNAGASTMTWTSPGVTGNCTNLPTGVTMAVQRR